MKRIGLLTSGGDASGMNAAIRAVARTAASMGVEAVGFERGYDGLISNTWMELNSRSVAGILELGGTMLKSARSELFRTEEGRKQAVLVIQQNRLDGMVIIGGNGCLLYTSDAADEEDSVDLGGRRIIKKKKK